ncbi:MAG: ATPase domain-containing protein [Nanoarchaeota archaeon]
MSIFSKLFKKEEKLTQEQVDEIEEKVQETMEKYSKEEKLSAELPKHIEKKVEQGKINPKQKEILKQREEVHETIKKSEHIVKDKHVHEFVKTGILGFDELLEHGIPKGAATLLCGGPGSGKTIFGLQILNNAASRGEKCIYMTFEENEEKLRQHMEDFGWDWRKLEKQGNFVIKRYDPFQITRSVEALLEKAKGELMIDVSPVLFPEGFKPEWVVIDSVTAIASAFYGREETYRIYIEQLFRLLETIGATSFLITESTQILVKLTESGVEEFLADGVIILYNIKSGNVRESAIEVLKLRGTSFQKKIVAMKVESNKGIVVYPEQEVFGGT